MATNNRHTTLWTTVINQARTQAAAWKTFLLGHSGTLIEWGIIALVVVWTGRGLLDFDPHAIPYGADFLPNLQTQHFWDSVKICGACALWNGAMMGGIPALTDIMGANLNPLSALLFILFGAINGSKILVLCTLVIAGLAQWWLAKSLQLGRLARVWSALIGATGAHLAGKLDFGLVTLVLSASMFTLALAAILHFYLHPHRKSALLVAGCLFLLATSGQGYYQIAFLLSLPLYLILFIGRDFRPVPAIQYIPLILGLAALLTAPLWVPFLHFFPNFLKPSEPHFNLSQPLEYLVLNLVIRDLPFLASEMLTKPGSVGINTLYIGWLPPLLAALSVRFIRANNARLIAFLAAFSVYLFWLASGEPFKLLAALSPDVGFVRFHLLIGSIAVPPLLCLAALALDEVWKCKKELRLVVNDSPNLVFRLSWLVLIPLLVNLVEVTGFSAKFLNLHRPDVPFVQKVLREVSTPSLQWVNPPEGNWLFYEIAYQMGIKITPGYRHYEWRNREFPGAKLVIRPQNDPVEEARLVKTVGDFQVFVYDQKHEYASILLSDDTPLAACSATGWGGDLTVTCSSTQAGRLEVKENQWRGWYAWRDGTPVRLLPGQWLSVDAPPGEHTYHFRYLPWDVVLGSLFWLVGVGLCVGLWRKEAQF